MIGCHEKTSSYKFKQSLSSSSRNVECLVQLSYEQNLRGGSTIFPSSLKARRPKPVVLSPIFKLVPVTLDYLLRRAL